MHIRSLCVHDGCLTWQSSNFCHGDGCWYEPFAPLLEGEGIDGKLSGGRFARYTEDHKQCHFTILSARDTNDMISWIAENTSGRWNVFLGPTYDGKTWFKFELQSDADAMLNSGLGTMLV